MHIFIVVLVVMCLSTELNCLLVYGCIFHFNSHYEFRCLLYILYGLCISDVVSLVGSLWISLGAFGHDCIYAAVFIA